MIAIRKGLLLRENVLQANIAGMKAKQFQPTFPVASARFPQRTSIWKLDRLTWLPQSQRFTLLVTFTRFFWYLCLTPSFWVFLVFVMAGRVRPMYGNRHGDGPTPSRSGRKELPQIGFGRRAGGRGLAEKFGHARQAAIGRRPRSRSVSRPHVEKWRGRLPAARGAA